MTSATVATHITMDRNAGYENAAAEAFPNTEVVSDKFHIAKHMQEAIDQVRREERLTAPGLKTRWLWLHNERTLTAAQRERLKRFLPVYRMTGRAYNLRLELQEALERSKLAQAARAPIADLADLMYQPVRPLERITDRLTVAA